MSAARGPYAVAASLYRDAGWRGVLPLPSGEKNPPPEGYTGSDGRDPTDEEIEAWISNGKGAGNIALRVPIGVIGLDVDEYGNYRGAFLLAALEEQLGELPPTFVSSARPAPSGIRWYRVPDGVQFPGELSIARSPVKGIQAIQRHHRFAVVWPSIHPKGPVYEWRTSDDEGIDAIPSPSELPCLPDAWVEHFRIERTAPTPADRPLAIEHREPQWSHRVKRARDAGLSALEQANANGGSRHDAMLGGQLRLAYLEQFGDPGSTAALDDVEKAFVSLAVATRRDGGERGARDEWARALAGARAKAQAEEPGPLAPEWCSLRSLEAFEDHLRAQGARARAAQQSAPETSAGLRLFRTVSSADLLEAEEPIEWLVRGFLIDPTYGQIAGEMKTLKTYVASMLAVAVASGTSLFERFSVDRSSPVLMYVGEGGARPHRRRLRRICRAMGVEPDDIADRLHRSYDVAPVDSARYQASLHADLERITPGLFILDPFYAFHGTGADARNLHEEGAHLVKAVELAREAGASALIVNHFNQTGSGVGLKRITQAGSGEWADSWALLGHREPADVAAGRFRLSLDVGSRQWGGSTWDLDLNVGRFDPDLGHHDGEITWELRAAGSSGGASAADRIVAAVTAEPEQLIKEELAKLAGGNIVNARRLVDHLAEAGRIRPVLVEATTANGKNRRSWRYAPGDVTTSGLDVVRTGDVRGGRGQT